MNEPNKEAATGYGKIVTVGTVATAVTAIGHDYLNPEAFDMITRFGLPLVLLAIVTKYSMSLISSKDAEIKRLNEARVRDTLNHADRLYKVTAAAQKMVDQNNETLDLVARNNQP